MNANYLVDKSALARMTDPAVARRLAPLIEAGEVATCAIVELEVLYSARSHADLVETARRRRLAYEWVSLDEVVFERALSVQQLLAPRGHHRLPIPDLIIAAAAEVHGLRLLHYDKDFDTIASVTNQPTEWVVERGSVE